MNDENLDKVDFRYQAVTTLAEDFKSPYTGIVHKQGTIVCYSAITQYSKKTTITFPIPNVSAMYLDLSSKYFKDSHKELLKIENLENRIGESVKIKDIPAFFDLLEKRIASIILAYTALEVFANQTIPDNYIYYKERQDNKCKEIYSKEQIEHWIPLDEKLSDVLPKVLTIESPKNKKSSNIWDKYKKLKKSRNRFIHLKSKDVKSSDIDKDPIWNILTAKNLEDPSIITKEIISFFIKGMKQKPRWFTKLPF